LYTLTVYDLVVGEMYKYTVGWPELYKYTVYDVVGELYKYTVYDVVGEIPAKITVYYNH